MNERRPHGRLVLLEEDRVRSFVPDPLPPPLDWVKFAPHLSAADHAVGRLEAEGRRLPNPALLLPSLVRREAVLSSRIEGTVTTLSELLASRIGAPTRDRNDLQEVRNYVDALEWGRGHLDGPLTLDFVLALHERLMRGVRNDAAMPGEFRDDQNWIGLDGSTLATAIYVPPPVSEMQACLNHWENFLKNRELPDLVVIALAHSQFEAIHPFADGNGRVGRLVITLMFLERGLVTEPFLHVSGWIEATRQSYYDGLLGVTRSGEWEQWLIYFLEGVRREAEDVIGRIQEIEDFENRSKRKLTGRSRIPEKALELFVRNPFWTVEALTDELKVSLGTARNAVRNLAEAGIVKKVAVAKRNQIWCAEELLKILERPILSSSERPSRRTDSLPGLFP